MARTAPIIVSLAIAFAACGAARAQDLDYGAYEGLFDEPVTASATGKPERLSDTPVIMDIITAADIQRSGVRDLPTLLRRLPGIDVVHTGPGTQELAMGYVQPLGSRVMVLLNGRQVYFDGFGEVFWSSLPVELDEIRQIEVIRGPQSALYGFNALDGVINIITADPLTDDINSARVRIGSDARRDISATTTQSLGALGSVRITAAGDHANDSGMVDPSRANSAYREDPNRRSAAFDYGVVLPDGGRLGVEASHTDVTQRSIAYNQLYAARIVTNSLKGSYTTDTDIGRVNGTAYINTVTMPWVNAQPFGPFQVSDRTLVAQLSDLFKLGAADSFRLGLEARHHTMNTGNLTDGTLSGDLGAGSAMWEHAFSPTISAVSAVRYDYFKLGRSGPALPFSVSHDIFSNADFDRSLQGLSVNTALIDRITPNDSLRLSFGRGLRLPSLANFGQVQRYVGSPLPLYYYGNPDLGASAVYDYQLGWDHKFASLDAIGRINLFHQMTMSHIGTPYLLSSNNQLVLMAQSGAGSVNDGLKLQLDHKSAAGWQWGFNYTYSRLREHYDWGFRNAEPTHKLNANLGYAWGRWEADLYGTYTSATKGFGVAPGPIPTLFVASFKSYETLGPRLAWHPTDKAVIELVSENLWSYRDNLVQRTGANVYMSVKLGF